VVEEDNEEDEEGTERMMDEEEMERGLVGVSAGAASSDFASLGSKKEIHM
jgi:hypothetical protein